MAEKLEIVVVDDEAQITDLLATFINFCVPNANIRTFNDPCEALGFLKSSPVDILITDYQMPKIDGISLMESIDPAIKKILVSGYVSEIAEEKLQRLNAEFFEKPVRLPDLGKVINDYSRCRVSHCS